MQMAGSGNNLVFQLPVSSVLNSLVTLSVNADSLTLTTNEAPGRIVSAEVSNAAVIHAPDRPAVWQEGVPSCPAQPHGRVLRQVQSSGFSEHSRPNQETKCHLTGVRVRERHLRLVPGADRARLPHRDRPQRRLRQRRFHRHGASACMHGSCFVNHNIVNTSVRPSSTPAPSMPTSPSRCERLHAWVLFWQS